MESIYGFADVHLLSILASIIGGVLLFKVPQITNLWTQLPNTGLELIGFVALVSILILLYPVTLLWLWQRTLFGIYAAQWREKIVSFIQGSNLLKRATDYLLFPPRFTTRVLLLIARKFTPLSKGIFGGVLVVFLAVAGVWLMWQTPLDLPMGYLMAGAFIRMCGFWILMVAVWLGFGKYFGVENVLDDTLTQTKDSLDLIVRQQQVWRSAGRVLSWIAISTCVGELLWITAALQFPNASYRLYSVWAAFHLPAMLVGSMIVVDMTQLLVASRTRIYFVLGIIVLMFIPSLQSNSIQDEPSTGKSATAAATKAESEKAASEAWLNSFEERIDSRPKGPVVIVAASGGGSRAALFSALVLQHLASQPMEWGTPKPGQGAQTATETPATDGKGKTTWADNIVLISSVSGGSLTTARYIADPSLGAKTVKALNYTSTNELKLRTKERLEDWTTTENGSAMKALPVQQQVEEEELERLKKILDTLNDVPTKSDPTIAASITAAFSSKLADDMAADFMAPILRGVLTPFATRGDTLYHFWQTLFGWNTIAQNNYLLNSSVSEAEEGQPHSLPHAVFNTTDVETGRRVIIGFPPIQEGLLVGSQAFPPQVRRATGSTARSTIYGAVALADFSPEQITSLSLTRSVRLSSNFPWGFGVQPLNHDSQPPIQPTANTPTARGQGIRDSLALIDGGVVDNTGIDSIAEILESLLLRAEADPFGTSARIVDKLRRRGIVFIEIDSGAKPTGSDTDETTMGDVLTPLTALNNAAYTNALRIGDDLIDDMLLKFSASPLAANISPLPFGQLGVANPYFRDLQESQVRAALGIVFPGDSDPDRALQSLYHYRFSCNHSKETKADVMTAFALGPEDKAIVYAMFLSEAQQWQDWSRQAKNNYRSYQEYFPDSPTEIKKLTKEQAQQLAFQLIDRTQTELQTLQARIAENEGSNGLSQFEKEKRLKRIVTMLISIRSLASVDGAWEMKSDLWQSLSGITRYLDSDLLAKRVAVTTAPAGSEATSVDEATIVRIDPEQIKELFDYTKRTRQETKWEASSTSNMISSPIQTSVETSDSVKQTIAPPLLRDAMRQKSAESQRSEEQRKFFKSKN